MLRHSLYKKFGKKFYKEGGSDENPFGIPSIKPPAPLGNYSTKEQPEGTITSGDASYAPGTFNTDKASSMFTPDASPFFSNINPENIYDVDQSTPEMEQGPLTKSETEKRGLMSDYKIPEPSFKDKLKSNIKSIGNDIKENWQDYATVGLTGALGAANYMDAQRKETELNQSIQSRQSKPLYDYNYMYGRTTSGGTEYQPIVMAQKGAKITNRYNTPEGVNNNVEIEDGEFLILPDGTSEVAKGPSHSQSYKADGQSMSGINTILPNNTRVFSNHMKPSDGAKLNPEEQFAKIGAYLQAGGDFSQLDMTTMFRAKKGKDSNKTFAEIAKRYDNTEYDEVLKNPFAKEVDKQTARIMKERNDKVLDQLFRDQQFLNGNSNGEQKQMAKGGINNPGFEALPGYVQAKITANMAEGGDVGSAPVNTFMSPGVGNDPKFEQYYNQQRQSFTQAGVKEAPSRNDIYSYYQSANPQSAVDQTGRMLFSNPKGTISSGTTFSQAVDPNTGMALNQGTNLEKSAFDQQAKRFAYGGKLYMQDGAKKYKLPEGTVLKKEGDKTIKPGDYVQLADGTVKKLTKIDTKRVREASKSSVASNYDEGKTFIKSWASQSPENQQKLELANAAFQRGINEGSIKVIKEGPKKGQYEITGSFKPANMKERLAMSDVINKSGKGFGTDQFQIGLQTGTEGYSQRDPKTGTIRGTGSFVAGFSPAEYEQRFTYARAKAEGMSEDEAIELAESQDPKVRAENRKTFLKDIGMNSEGVPDEALLSDDFYKNRYSDITKNIEKSFGEGDFRPSMGNDLMSGWEHYDAINYQGNPMYEDVPEEPENPGGIPDPNFPERGKYTRMPYDTMQAIPGAYGLAQAQDIFPYAIPEVQSPYIKPQTLNIQSELQDIDNMQASALRAGADPNMTYAMSLDAKNKAFQTKQNYDAEGRWKADATNFDAELKTNAMNAELFNKTYNDMYATAKSNQSEAKLAAVTGLVGSRAQYNADENMKEFYHNNFMPSYNWDPKTKTWSVVNPGDIVDYANKKQSTGTTGTTGKTTTTGTTGTTSTTASTTTTGSASAQPTTAKGTPMVRGIAEPSAPGTFPFMSTPSFDEVDGMATDPTQNLGTKFQKKNGGLQHAYLKAGGKIYHFTYPKS
jgi:hypothetical protein